MKSFKASALKIEFPEYAITSDPFEVKPSEWCEIKASSGFGKTTLMRGVLGFQKMEGEIHLGDRRIDLLPVHERNFGVVFQDQLLFPHLTALQNSLFGIKLRTKLTSAHESQAKDAFKRLGLESRIDAPIQELSGGERQRVALIRATLFNPDLLVLDEPFKGLDPQSISLMLDYLQSFILSHPIPVIWISHQVDVEVAGVQLIGGNHHGQRHFRFTRNEP
jgi:ABC-type Fe3+/spermidine/putrescine transport system ATPase subunit